MLRDKMTDSFRLVLSYLKNFQKANVTVTVIQVEPYRYPLPSIAQ